MNSPDVPFRLHDGNTKQDAIYNRIACIERIEYLTGINLRNKSADYLKVLDLALYKKWYHKENPKKFIDEEFCQRAVEIIRDLEGKSVILDEKEYKQTVIEHNIKSGGSFADERSQKD